MISMKFHSISMYVGNIIVHRFHRDKTHLLFFVTFFAMSSVLLDVLPHLIEINETLTKKRSYLFMHLCLTSTTEWRILEEVCE